MIPIRLLARNFVGLKVYDAGVCFGLGQPVKTGYRIGKQKKCSTWRMSNFSGPEV